MKTGEYTEKRLFYWKLAGQTHEDDDVLECRKCDNLVIFVENVMEQGDAWSKWLVPVRMAVFPEIFYVTYNIQLNSFILYHRVFWLVFKIASTKACWTIEKTTILLNLLQF